jgi:transposase
MAIEEIIRSVTDQEQRSFIEISYLLNLPASFIHKQLKKALPRRTVSRRTVERWLGYFREGRADTSDEESSGRPRTAMDEQHRDILLELLQKSCIWFARELAYRHNIGLPSVHQLLREDLGLVKKQAHWVPHTSSPEQMQMREDIAYNNLFRYRADPSILDQVIALDESWVSLYTPLSRHKAKF